VERAVEARLSPSGLRRDGRPSGYGRRVEGGAFMNTSRMMLAVCTVAAVLLTVGAVTTHARFFAVAEAGVPAAHAAATCSDYPNQKAAQEAADTRDADGDGIYCVIYSG
jgi:hypothetical protein